jgi:hypothetical protein
MRLLKRAAHYLGALALRGLVWLFLAPMRLATGVVHFSAVRPLLGDSIRCRTCRTRISLLGLWQCGRCGYSWAGFYFARCEVCGDVPPFLECERCGASTPNPLIFG